MATIFFIAYDYDTNYIFEKPIINVTDTTIVDINSNQSSMMQVFSGVWITVKLN